MKEYIKVPLSTESLIMGLTNTQAGRLFKAVFNYAFNDIKPNFSDDPGLRKAFVDFIKQCSKITEDGLMCYTTTFEDYEE